MRRPLFAFLFTLLLVPVSARATPIVINPGAGLAGNLPALAAFNRAANTWGALFSDPITVNISANLVSLANPSVIGQASSVALQGSYNLVRDAVVADAANEADDAIVAATPTAAQFDAFLPAGIGLLNGLGGTKANLKALGFADLDTNFGTNDATIEFNSNFTFDYDRSDGITPGWRDFESVALHEIGHALGFVSVVDEIDFYRSLNLPENVVLYTLDLFRFGAAPGLYPTTISEFTTMPRMLVPGVNAVFSDLSSQWALSTGQLTGDGRQASHWKDDALTGLRIGAMDPTLDAGTIFQLTAADLRVMDLIGWDLQVQQVPEPASMVLVGAGVVAALRRRRKGAQRGH